MLDPNIFTLLKNILSDSRGLSFQYFPSQDCSITDADFGIRQNMQQSEALYDSMRRTLFSIPFGEVWIIRDSLMLTTAAFRADPDQEGIFLIGPFRSLPFEEADYGRLASAHGMTHSGAELLRVLLRRVPGNIQRSEALAVAKNVLFHLHGIQAPVILERDLSRKTGGSIPLVPIEDLNTVAGRVEEIYRHEALLMKYVSEGNVEKALEEGVFFSRSNIDRPISNRLLSHRSLMYSANTGFRLTAQKKGIHPYYLDQISVRFARSLSLCTSFEQLMETYFEMIREYCRFCKEHDSEGYSADIQAAVDYIRLNLSEDLTPDIIAEAVGFSTGYLSRKFREKTGQSISAYITGLRIRTSRQLLETTDMTIKEISVYVGIPDWNYFTKLFRKTEGMTPSEYRRRTASSD